MRIIAATLLLATIPAPSGGGDSVPSYVVPERGASPIQGSATGAVAVPAAAPHVADLLELDGATAGRLARQMERLYDEWQADAGIPEGKRRHIEPALLYDIAHEAARWSRVNSIRPEVLVGLMFVESKFDPGARSPTNDHGICQLHGKRVYGIRENIRAGAAHLAGNVKAAGGDYNTALQFYNGGVRGPRLAVCRRYARKVLAAANGGDDG